MPSRVHDARHVKKIIVALAEGVAKETVCYNLTYMQQAGTLELPFAKDLESKPKSFISQVKEFMQETDGGAIPVTAAAVALGVSKQRIDQLIRKELETPGAGLRAKKFNKTVLVYISDIEKRLDMPKKKGGRPKKEK